MGIVPEPAGSHTDPLPSRAWSNVRIEEGRSGVYAQTPPYEELPNFTIVTQFADVELRSRAYSSRIAAAHDARKAFSGWEDRA